MGKINCFHCLRKCRGDVLKVGEKYFHKECFTCKVCHRKLDELGFFFKDGCFYCQNDFKDYCAAKCFTCKEKIVGEVVTALNYTFHKDCFKCSSCHAKFLPGSRVSMKNKDFLCSQCSSQVYGNQISSNASSSINRPSDRIQQQDSFNHKIKDNDSSSVPLRRKVKNSPEDSLPNSLLLKHQNKALSMSSCRLRPNSGECENEISALGTPKHFHIPSGRDRSWISSPNIVGSKNHPLALSATNINRSLSSSTQHVNEDEMVNKENIKKLSSYPSGCVNGSEEHAIEQDDFPGPPASSVILMDKSRRKVQNPTVEALSVGATPNVKKKISHTSDKSPTHNSGSIRMGISEILKQSSTDCSNLDKPKDISSEKKEVPVDPISASRTPSATCEPMIPPRYEFHSEASPSRNDEFIRSSDRHIGYSMDFVNSTSRSFLSNNTVPRYRMSLRNSTEQLGQVNDANYNCLRKLRSANSSRSPRRVLSSNGESEQQSYQSNGEFFIFQYEQLRTTNLKMIRHLDKTRLESYLSDEEFRRIFNLTRSAFYSLPEWKRNDLKKKVDLF